MSYTHTRALTLEERRAARDENEKDLTPAERKAARAARRSERTIRTSQRADKQAQLDRENPGRNQFHSAPPACIPMHMRDPMREDARRRREIRRADAQGVDPGHSDWKLHCDRQGIDSTLTDEDVDSSKAGNTHPLNCAKKNFKALINTSNGMRQLAFCFSANAFADRNRRPNYVNIRRKIEHHKWLEERAIRHRVRREEAEAREGTEDLAGADITKELIESSEFSADDAEDTCEMQVEPPLIEKGKCDRKSKRSAGSSSSEDSDGSDESTDEDAFTPSAFNHRNPDDDTDANGALVQEPGLPSTKNET
jgi:hypothetical protein